jgi:hypothetical protein
MRIAGRLCWGLDSYRAEPNLTGGYDWRTHGYHCARDQATLTRGLDIDNIGCGASCERSKPNRERLLTELFD